MKTRAAVAFEAKRPLEIVEVDLDGPRAGEVLVEIMATGVCHTDAYTLDGLDSEGIFPSILGHEGAGHPDALLYAGLERNGRPEAALVRWGQGRRGGDTFLDAVAPPVSTLPAGGSPISTLP